MVLLTKEKKSIFCHVCPLSNERARPPGIVITIDEFVNAILLTLLTFRAMDFKLFVSVTYQVVPLSLEK